MHGPPAHSLADAGTLTPTSWAQSYLTGTLTSQLSHYPLAKYGQRLDGNAIVGWRARKPRLGQQGPLLLLMWTSFALLTCLDATRVPCPNLLPVLILSLFHPAGPINQISPSGFYLANKLRLSTRISVWWLALTNSIWHWRSSCCGNVATSLQLQISQSHQTAT